MTRQTIPTENTVRNILRSAINNHSPLKNKKREQWRHYRYFFATRTLKDMPVGSGTFIAIAGIIHPPHEGWFYVATRELLKNLKKWEHWKDVEALYHNKDLVRVCKPHLQVKLEKLSDDPKDWVLNQSSRYPEEWIQVQTRPGAGRWKHAMETDK